MDVEKETFSFEKFLEIANNSINGRLKTVEIMFYNCVRLKHDGKPEK